MLNCIELRGLCGSQCETRLRISVFESRLGVAMLYISRQSSVIFLHHDIQNPLGHSRNR